MEGTENQEGKTCAHSTFFSPTAGSAHTPTLHLRLCSAIDFRVPAVPAECGPCTASDCTARLYKQASQEHPCRLS